MATQEIADDFLSAGHPSIPVGSKARITNIANDKQIEVTIIFQVPPSDTRIIDLSPAAALALDIGFPNTVIVNAIGTLSLTQRGMATQEMIGRLFAAHPILPIGSMVKVTNLKNGKEIILTITDQIPPSDTRIIDLSSAAAYVLDIGKGGLVTIEVLSMP
jgi:rare lipoprotein A (peptidoglycan hydrolase)